jgi:transposase
VLRQPHRALRALQEERTPHMNRITGLLAGLGLDAVSDPTLPERLLALRPWDGPPGPALLHERLLRACARWALVQRQRQALENAEARRGRDDPQRPVEQVRTRMRLRGSGAQSAWLWVHAGFGGRQMGHRRELAALAGLTPTPYHAGQARREPGLRKAGRTRRRWLMVAWAWGGWPWHPESARSRWYQARLGHGSARRRQLGLVALARTLLSAVGRLVAQGEVPPGAVVADWDRQVPRRWATRRPGGTAVAV